jgi:O-antigen/teichoic acid export membrane protein
VNKGISQRVRQSMLSMFVARPLSALGGLMVLVLLSRFLTPIEYAIYFSIWAICEIIILTSSLGLLQAVYRYISANELNSGMMVAHGPVMKLLLWRVITLLAASAVFLLFPGMNELVANGKVLKDSALYLIAGILFFEGLARYIEVIFDSMLCQGKSQFTQILRTLVKMLGLIYLYFFNEINIINVIYIELLATGVGALIAVLLLSQLLLLGREVKQENSECVSFMRMTKFALPTYIAGLIGIAYSVDALKIVLASSVGANELALFGFAYSLAAVIQRYMPVNILAGIFRPIFVAASKKENSELVLSNILGLLIKINCIFILPILFFLVFSGDKLLGLISHSNYSQAGLVTVVIVAGFIPLTFRLSLSIYCIAKEITGPPLFSTIAALISLPLGIILGEHWGAVGVAFALASGEIIWSILCLLLLSNSIKYKLRLHIYGTRKLFISGVLAIFIPSIFIYIGLNTWYILALVSVLVFLMAMFNFGIFSAQEKKLLSAALPKKLTKKIGWVAD